MLLLFHTVKTAKMKILIKIIKWLLIAIVALLIVGFIALKVVSEDRPAAIPNSDPDAVANEMLVALNKPAWDSLKYLKWEFMRGHQFLWDKQGNNALVKWDNIKVVLDLDKVSGVAYKDGNQVDGDIKNKLIQEAWSHWCNDSFWMFAPFKVFDKGTSRSIVETGNDQKGLMITYETGGVTPGDSYLWLLDNQNIPTGYKMWTFIPVKGMHMTWEGWKTLKGGAKVAVSHKSAALSFDMKDVAEGGSPAELGYSNNIFDNF
ncbi:MAG: hypothetical protein ACI86M_000062 [Saprospiraceae bacterium]|jgi:hypothetical protein